MPKTPQTLAKDKTQKGRSKKMVQTTLFGTRVQNVETENPPKTKRGSKRTGGGTEDTLTCKKRAKVTRKEFLTKVIKATSTLNLRKRKVSEATWTMAPITQYRKKKKSMQEKFQMKGRATQGWMPKETVEEITKGANMFINRRRKKGKKTLRVPRTTILAACANIIRDILHTNRKLYIRCMKNVNKRRKDEGVSLAAISNRKLDYRAEMLSRKTISHSKKRSRSALSIGGKQAKISHKRPKINGQSPTTGGSPQRGSRSPEKGGAASKEVGHGTGIT
jgi:hypothetical protein